MATAVVEERQLLKTLRWYDGFVIALANPGFLLGSLGYSVGDLGGWGAALLWGISAVRRRLHQHALLRARRDVPGEVRRTRALRARGLAEVHDARRSDRDVRLLDRVVGRACDQRHLHRPDHPGCLVPGRALRRRVEQPGRHGLLLDGHGQGRAAAAHRDRADPRRLGLQRARCARRHLVRLPRRSAADGAALRDDDPAVPQRQLRQREPRQHDQGDRLRRGAACSSRSCGCG